MLSLAERPYTPRRHSEDRQREIVEAVLNLAAQKGVEAVTTHLIAERLGLTQGALFRHFPSKEAIWSAVLDWLQANVKELFRRQPGTRAVDELERIFSGYMDVIAAYPAMPRLVFSDTFHHAHPVLHIRARGMVSDCESWLRDLIEEAIHVGDLRQGRAEAGAKLFLTTIQGLAFQTAILGLVTDPRAAGMPLFAFWRAAMTCKETP